MPFRILLLVCLFIAGCSTDPHADGFYERALAPPSGIIETDPDGRVINEPPGEFDWEVAPNYRGVLFVEPAYPNPARVTDRVQIPVLVRTTGDVRGGLYIERVEGHNVQRLADHPEASEPGSYVLRFDAALLGGAGLYRVYIVDGRGSIASYGDIRIE